FVQLDDENQDKFQIHLSLQMAYGYARLSHSAISKTQSQSKVHLLTRRQAGRSSVVNELWYEIPREELRRLAPPERLGGKLGPPRTLAGLFVKMALRNLFHSDNLRYFAEKELARIGSAIREAAG